MAVKSMAVDWEARRAEYDAIRRVGKVRLRGAGTRLHVIAPESSAFAVGARELGGRWRYRSQVWTFPGHARRLVVGLIERTYGAEALE